ncbi:MAG TPA: transglutaminase-like domain-containing protein [Clostridia bacterium]|nr:transglutaminase-like domain-containing protein [Clostridia bacterium]
MAKGRLGQTELMNLFLGLGFTFINTWCVLEMFGYSEKLSLEIALVLSGLIFSGYSIISLLQNTLMRTFGIFVVAAACITSLIMLATLNLGALKVYNSVSNCIKLAFLSVSFFSFVNWYFTFIRYRFIVLIGASSFLLGIRMIQCSPLDLNFILFFILCLIGWVERTRRKSLTKDASNQFTIYKFEAIFLVISFICLMLINSFITLSIPRNAGLDRRINNVFKALSVNAGAGKGGILSNNAVLLDPFKFSNQVISDIEESSDSTVLMEISGDNPRYLKIQAWSTYRNGKWSVDGMNLKGMVSDDTPFWIYTSLKAKVENRERQCTITCRFPSNRSIPVPSTIFDLRFNGFRSDYYMDDLNEVYLPQGVELKENDSYTVKFYDDTHYFYTNLQFSTLLDDYLLQVPDELKDKLYNLSQQIVAGIDSDYGKAAAIERYFTENGFKYVLNPQHVPEGVDPVEYFLFNSKKGNCTLFATAMVLLARSAGIPTMYNAGYLTADSANKDGNILVRAKDAHAFPELFIKGWGWKVFEPTVSSAGSTGENNNKQKSVENKSREESKSFLTQLGNFFVSICTRKSVPEKCLALGILLLSAVIIIPAQALVRRLLRKYLTGSTSSGAC